MNTAQATPRAVLAIRGGQAGRRHAYRTHVIARQLDLIAHGTVHVRTVPVTHNGRRRTYLDMTDVNGRTVATAPEQCRAAYGLLARMFPGADWTRPAAYDARTGRLAVDEPTAPTAAGIDTAPEARQ